MILVAGVGVVVAVGGPVAAGDADGSAAGDGRGCRSGGANGDLDTGHGDEGHDDEGEQAPTPAPIPYGPHCLSFSMVNSSRRVRGPAMALVRSGADSFWVRGSVT